MRKLSQTSAELLMRFADRAINAQTLLPAFGQPVLELLKGNPVLAERDMGYLFSIGQLEPVRKNIYGARMQFVIVDKRKDTDADPSLLIYPVCFQSDTHHVLQESCKITGKYVTTVNEPYQRGQCILANRWLPELVQAGYLR